MSIFVNVKPISYDCVYMSIFVNAKPISLLYFVFKSQKKIQWQNFLPLKTHILLNLIVLLSKFLFSLSYSILTIQSFNIITKSKLSKSLY